MGNTQNRNSRFYHFGVIAYVDLISVLSLPKYIMP